MKKLILILLSFLFTACLEEVEIPLNDFNSTLVIEGYLDTASDIHTVLLSNTSDLTGIGPKNQISNAQVRIEGMNGVIYPLEEVENGIYQSQSGAIEPNEGDSYRLVVVLENGSEFFSSFETVMSPISILGANVSFKEKITVNENLVEETQYFHDLFIEVENSINTHFFKVDNLGWAQVEVFYELGPPFNPPPPPGPTTCWQLRDPINNQLIALGTNTQINADSYSLNPVSVLADRQGDYVATLTVQSMSQPSFQYWEDVNDQLNQQGGIFDRQLAPIKGNIINESDNQNVLGYFHVYNSSQIEICFDRSEAPVTPNTPVLTSPILCTEYWNPATFDNMSELLCN